MPAFISGAHHDKTAAVAHIHNIGLLTTPATNYRHHGVRSGKPVLVAYPFWAADNGAFKMHARYGDFNFAKWARWVEDMVNTTPAEVMDRHLFFTSPDAIDVDPHPDNPKIPVVTSYPQETLARAQIWLPWLRSLGLRTALVAQPGHENQLDEIPWDQLDVIFLGGDDAWKESPHGALVVAREAQRRGKHVHMGRVNTRRRLTIATAWNIDTADGNKLGRGVDKNLPGLLRWLGELNVAREELFDLLAA
jgi:hypothetical protein